MMLPNTVNNKLLFVLFLVQLLFLQCAQAETALQITGSGSDRTVWKAGDKPIAVTFNITKPSHVVLDIYDARDYLVRRISSSGLLSAGDHSLLWDGKDDQGKVVPPEAYVYTLTAKSTSGEQVVFDLTDQTGGETMLIDDITYDAGRKIVRYHAPSSARVFVRIGLEEGSVLRTLVNGAARSAGVHEEPWDGLDESSVLSLSNHPKLQLFGEGFRLSRNTLLVEHKKSVPTRPQWITPPVHSDQKRDAIPKGKGLNLHAYHDREACRDVEITLSLPKDLPKNAEGLPIVSGPTPLRMDVAAGDDIMLEAQRFEVVYFLNNRLLYENEISYVPYTWTWDPKTRNGGVNYLSAFVVGFGGHFGVSTVKFVLAEN